MSASLDAYGNVMSNCSFDVSSTSLSCTRSQTHKYHHRGLRQFCSVLGKGPQEYKYIPRFFDAALDKIGQILRTSKWLRSQTKIPLETEPLFPAGILVRYLCHFDASVAELIGPDPKALLNLKCTQSRHSREGGNSTPEV
jgi:hypothetical protein